MNIILNLLIFGAIISAILTITSINPIMAIIGLISVYIYIAIYLILLSCNFIGLSYIIIYVGAIAILLLFVIMMMNIKYIELNENSQENFQNQPMIIIIGSLFMLEILSSALMPLNSDLQIFEVIKNLSTEIFNSITNSKADPNYFDNLLGLSSKTSLDVWDKTVNIQNLSVFDFKESVFRVHQNDIDSKFWDTIFYSFSHIESIGYTLYTFGIIWFILATIILLMAMIGPIILCLEKKS